MDPHELDFIKELGKIKERVNEAVVGYNNEKYIINEKAREGGYFIDVDGDEREIKHSADLEEQWKPKNLAREKVERILKKSAASVNRRENLLSESYDMLTSVAPMTSKPKGRLIIHDDATIQSLAKIPEELLSPDLVDIQSQPVTDEKDRIFNRLKFILKDHKRLKEVTMEHITILNSNEDTIVRQRNEIEGLSSKLNAKISKIKTQQTVILKMKKKQQKIETSNQMLEIENKKYAQEIRKLEIKLEIEKDALAKRGNMQSKLSLAEVKLQQMENTFKDIKEENRKLKRINKQAENYLGNLNKDIMISAEEEKDSAEMQKQLDKIKQLLFKTEDQAKKREIELKDQIINLQREFLDASSTLLKNKTIISKMEENRVNLMRKVHLEKEEMRIDYEKRLKDNMEMRAPFMKIHVGTNTEQPIIVPRPLTASSATSLGEQILSPALSPEEQFQNLQLGFISNIKDDNDGEFSVENRRDFKKEKLVNFFRSLLHAAVKNVVGNLEPTNVNNTVIEKFLKFVNVTMEHKFEMYYNPLINALEDRDALRKKVIQLQQDWDASMKKKVKEASTKNVLLSAMPSRRNSFSQSSCQVQTEALSLNSNETQTVEKQTREVGTQAYLSDGFQNNIEKSNKAIDKRWSFLTEQGGGMSSSTGGFSLRGQSFMSPNTKVDPQKMKQMVTKLMKEGYEINRNSKKKQWKYLLKQYRMLHFWKKLSDRILPASEKESMDKTQEWAMKRWRKNRTSSEFLRQQQQKMTKKLWKVSCDKALQLVRTTADIPVVTPKSDRPKKSPRDSQPKKSPWDRESARHAARDIWSSTASPRGTDDTDGDSNNKKEKDGWSAVTLSYHPIDFTNMRPTNYIKVSNIHKFNKPHFDPRAKRPHSSRIGKRALKKLSIQGLGGGDKAATKSKAKVEDAIKENSPPQRRPASARVIKKKNVKFAEILANDNGTNSMIPPKKKQSEVGKPSSTAFGTWLEAPIPTPKSTITVMKGQIKKQKRSKNTYGKSNNMKKQKFRTNRGNSSKGGIIKNVVVTKNVKRKKTASASKIALTKV